jgi:hypothetical protein
MAQPTRRAAAIAMGAFTALLAACGGGGGGGGALPPAPSPGGGEVVSATLSSAHTGFTYPIEIFLPASYASGTASYPVIYATEGDAPYGTQTSGSGATTLASASRFNAFKEAMQRRNTQAILVGIGGTERRGTDFLPPGAAPYTRFIAKELAPYIEARWRADPKRRALSGLSHGGYYVILALIIEAMSGTPSFSHYLSTESSAGVHPGGIADFLELERQLDTAGPMPLPVTLFITGAPGFNLARADAIYDQMASHHHPGLTLLRAQYNTSHVGADLPAFEEALQRFFSQ